MMIFSDKTKNHNFIRIHSWIDMIKFRSWTEEIFLIAFHPFFTYKIPKLRTNSSTCLKLTAYIYIYTCKQICTRSLFVCQQFRKSRWSAGSPGTSQDPDSGFVSWFQRRPWVITTTLAPTQQSVSKQTCFQAYYGIFGGGLLLIF